MQMPTVGPEIARLTELFAGTWKGEEKLYPSDWDPDGGPAFGTWTVTPSLDGFALIVDYAEERGGAVVYRGHGVHGWDADGDCFLTYWFDNIGILPRAPSRARLDGNCYSYQDASPTGLNRMTYSWEGDRFEFRIDISKDDGATWSPMHEGRYTRTR